MTTLNSYDYGDNLLRYSDAQASVKSYMFYHRFTMNYHYNFPYAPTSKLRWAISAGTGIVFNTKAPKKGQLPNPSILYMGGESENGTHLDETITMPYSEHIIFASARVGGFVNLGITADIHSKSCYLFSINLSYLQGFKTMEHTRHNYYINDNGIEKRYTYTTSNKGSGLSLQISRRFQLYPWKGIKNKIE